MSRPLTIVPIPQDRDAATRLSVSKNGAYQAELHRRLLEHMFDAIAVLAPDGTIRYQSPSVERILGYTPEEMVGKSTFDFVHPDDVARIREVFAALMAAPGNHGTAVYRYKHKDGSWRYLEASATNLVDDPVVQGIIINRRDVTDRVLLEQEREAALSALRNREESYRIVAETASDAIISIDQMGRIFFANGATEKIFGYEVGELIGATFTSLMPERMREFWTTALANYVKTGVRTMDWSSIRLFGVTKDGAEFPAEMSFSSYVHEGRQIFTAIVRDVSERRRLEEEHEALLRLVDKERARLNGIIEAIPLGIWESETIPGTYQQINTFVNKFFQEMTGYRLEEWTSTPNFWLELMHPEDRAMILEKMKTMPAGREIRNRFRYNTKDGRIIWLDVHMVLRLNEAGEMVGTTGFAMDVTDRILAEEALRRSERRYRSLTMATSHTIWLCEADGSVRVDDWVADLGLSPETASSEEVNSVWIESIHPDDREQALATLQQALAEQQPYELCYRMRTAGEDYRSIIARGVPVLDDNGNVYEWIGTGSDITEKREAEFALRQSEERLRVAIKNSPIMVFSQDRDLRYTWQANSALLKLHNRDVTGLCDRDIFPPEEAEVLTRLKRHVIERGRGIRSEVRLTVDGVARYFDLTIEPVRNAADEITGITVASMDITDRLKADMALRVSEERYRQIVETAQEGINIVDSTGRIVFANTQMTKILGYSTEELLQLSIFQFIAPEEQERAMQSMGRSNDGELLQVDMKLVKKDGSSIWCLISTAPIRDANGEVVGGLGMMTDITNRKRAEEALQQAHDQLEARVAERTAELAEMMHRLEEAYANQKRFIADASHDIRTPLTSVRTELDLLLRSNNLDPQVATALERMTRQVKRLTHLTDDLLMLAILDTKRTLQWSDGVRVDELLLQGIVDLSTQASERDVSWNVNFVSLFEIRCDSAALKRALTNVLQNAVKYSTAGTVIDVVLEGDDKNVVITVRDRGAGIRPEDLPHIFDRFYRGDQTRSTQGTGLGLAIVKAVVEGHGGTVAIDSTPDVGTTVRIVLPL